MGWPDGMRVPVTDITPRYREGWQIRNCRILGIRRGNIMEKLLVIAAVVFAMVVATGTVVVTHPQPAQACAGYTC